MIIGARMIRAVLFFFVVFCTLDYVEGRRRESVKRPHIVLILADDYGHANIGYNRKDENGTAKYEVHTPNLDAMAYEGVRLERHYSYKICSPSRSSLQSGRLAVHVNTANAGVTVANPEDSISGYAGIPRNMTGIATKLSLAGYRTAAVGKWDAGMATPEHTPLGRGYDKWLGYYQHANDYWTKGTPITSTGEIDNCLNHFTDFSLLNSSFRGGVRDALALENGTYEEDVFSEYGLSIIRDYASTVTGNDADDEDSPLFLFYAFHLCHSPLEVPEEYLTKIDKIVENAGGPPFDSTNRRKYAAMVLYLDTAVGKLVAALRENDMWEDTVLVFLSDNGGPIYEPGAANNFPLRAGKYADFEGGVRTNAFVSGGRVPVSARGSIFDGVVSVADWYATFASLAGVDPHDAAAENAGLPPVDGRDQWNAIVNGGELVRSDALHISPNAVLEWPYKLVTGVQPYSSWQSPTFPNCSTWKSLSAGDGPVFVDLKVFGQVVKPDDPAKWSHETWSFDCGYDPGCLFNVEEDPTEHQNLASDPAFANVARKLSDALAKMNGTIFSPDRGTPQESACLRSIEIGGFLGPFMSVPDGWYTPPKRPPSMKERLKNELLKLELAEVNKPGVEEEIDRIAQRHYGALSDYISRDLDSCIGPAAPSAT